MLKTKTLNFHDTHNSRRRFLTLLSSAATLSLINSFPLQAMANYKNRLYTPTQIIKLYGTYFIVDCWHHRILYSKDVNTPLHGWYVLDDDLAGPHSIASNGSLYVTEDTGRHAIKVYVKHDNQKFELIQTLTNMGIRPHRVLYDSKNKQFLTVGSGDQSIHIFSEQKNKLKVVFSTKIVELNKQYCRSITIKDNLLYFVGVNDILIFELKHHSIGRLVRKTKLDTRYQGSNDLFFNGKGNGLLTATPQKIFSFSSLSDLENGTAVDLSNFFKGTPYYIEFFDNKFWIPEITEYSAINYVTNLDLDIKERKRIFNYGPPNEASLKRRNVLPL